MPHANESQAGGLIIAGTQNRGQERRTTEHEHESRNVVMRRGLGPEGHHIRSGCNADVTAVTEALYMAGLSSSNCSRRDGMPTQFARETADF